MDQETRREGGYRPEIDGLRCVAVMSVVFYHAGLALVPGGFVGVDMFFVISGYLITSIIQSEIGEGRFSLFAFYERRIRRIFPALFAMLAFCIPFAWWLLPPVQLTQFSQSVVATTAFASNVLFRLNTGYFSTDAGSIPLLHTWSLAVEEQFYIGFPVLLLLIHKIRRVSLSAVLASGVAGSLAYCLYKQPLEPMGAFFLMPSRAWELAAGGLLAILPWRFGARADSARLILELIGFAMIVFALTTYSATTPSPGIPTLLPVFGTALILLASNGGGPIGGLLASRPFVGIGLISYSVYLWHQPLFALAQAWNMAHVSRLASWILVAVTLLLGWASWRIIELPFRARGRFSRRQVYSFALGGSAIIAAAGFAGYALNGVPQRYSESVLALAATTRPSPARTACHGEGLNYRPPENACRYFGRSITWAVLGDSHAIETGVALAEHLKRRDIGLVQLSASGCQPALRYEVPNPGCSQWFRGSFGWLERSREIQNVLLIFRHSQYLFGNSTGTEGFAPAFLTTRSPHAAREAYWMDFELIVQRLVASGKHVYVALPLPELPATIDRYIYRQQGNAAVIPVRDYEARNAFFLARIGRLNVIPNVTILDPRDAVCEGGVCNAIIGNEAMYLDDNHFSMPAARRFIAAEVKKGLLP
jgi:peptidoglycan/LPS O-acetylase OafA/YrhL